MILALLACAPEGPAIVQGVEAPLRVATWLDGKPTSGGGRVVVQVVAPRSGELSVSEPLAGGLEFSTDGDPKVEPLNESTEVRTQEWVFKGQGGHYEVLPVQATWTEGDRTLQAKSESLFVDLDVEAVTVGELGDIVEPPSKQPYPWAWIGGGAGVVLLLVGGTAAAFWPRKPQERKVLPPHVRVLSAWADLRSQELTDLELASGLSRLFREYLEAVFTFEATAETTSEIVARLQAMPALVQDDVPRAKRLLRATDRVKFADAATTTELLDALDRDLKAFVENTKPQTEKEA